VAPDVNSSQKNNECHSIPLDESARELTFYRGGGTDPVPIASIAIRVCPKLPPTTEERIADNRAQTVADSVMYRDALANAAEALGCEDVNAFLHAMGLPIGPPWQAKHKLAAAAAIAVMERQ
jgi:hypothetical protein